MTKPFDFTAAISHFLTVSLPSIVSRISFVFKLHFACCLSLASLFFFSTPITTIFTASASSK